jgi:hypothetical protein
MLDRGSSLRHYLRRALKDGPFLRVAPDEISSVENETFYRARRLGRTATSEGGGVQFPDLWRGQGLLDCGECRASWTAAGAGPFGICPRDLLRLSPRLSGLWRVQAPSGPVPATYS